MRRYYGYWDKKNDCFSTDYPPQHEKFGEAPIVIFGTMEPARHPKTGLWCETTKQWDACDAAAGTYTSGHREVVKPVNRSSEVRADMDQAMEKAVNQLNWGMAKMTEEQRAAHKEKNDQISKVYGIDAHNVLGHKK